MRTIVVGMGLLDQVTRARDLYMPGAEILVVINERDLASEPFKGPVPKPEGKKKPKGGKKK